MEKYLALCLSKRKLLIGEIGGEGGILRAKRYETGYMNRSLVMPVVKRSLEDYITMQGWVNDERPRAMGLAIGRETDDRPPSEFAPLGKRLSEIYNIPCRVDHTVNGVTQAVRRWGHGRECDSFIYINMDGVVEAGFFSTGERSGESLLVDTMGEGAIDRAARVMRDRHATRLYIPAEENIPVDVREVFFLSTQGDELCSRLVGEALDTIVRLISRLAAERDPDLVVMGGGMLSNGFLFPRIVDRLKKSSVAKKTLLTEFQPDYTGLVGAAAIAADF